MIAGLAAFALVALPAWAEDPGPLAVPADPPPAPAPDEVSDDASGDVSEEVVVWGQLAIQQARDDVVASLASLGWRRVGRSDGDIVFRPPHGWLGRARFTEGGELLFGRPVLGFSAPAMEAYTQDPRYEVVGASVASTDTAVAPGFGPWFWLLPSGAKIEPYRAKVREATRPAIDAYVAVVRRTALEEDLRGLPERLDALWTAGTPLVPGGPLLTTYAEKRAVILDLWSTRTDTAEGQRITAAIEAWIGAVVEDSEHPITPGERAAAEAERRDGRKLPTSGPGFQPRAVERELP